MSLSSIEVWQRITEHGLASPVQCRSWAGEALQSMSATDAANGIKVLQRLIELEKLTNYQAKILAGQSNQPLRRGPYNILRCRKGPVWDGWYEVARRQGDATVRKSNVHDDSVTNISDRISWARWVDSCELHQLRASAPGLPRALALSRVQSEWIQKVYPPELEEGSLLVRVAPIEGKLLIDEFMSTPPLLVRCSMIVRQVAAGLASLHASGIAHGRVLPDRVYVAHDRVVLAVDPLCSATAIGSDRATGLLSEHLRHLHAAQFIAPEFQLPGQSPTPASDVYSLGCLWWWLLTGLAPVSGGSTVVSLGDHAAALPRLPDSCELPEPLTRCLYHSLARNLSARFPSALEFCRAFDTAARLTGSDHGGAIAEHHASDHGSVGNDWEQVGHGRQAEAPAEMAAGGGEAPTGPVPRVPLTTALRKNQPEKTGVRRRKRGNRWVLTGAAGCGLLIMVLLALKLSGVVKPSPGRSLEPGQVAAYVPKPPQPLDRAATDRRLDFYRIVASADNALWAPPSAPDPIPIDLLPPGAQLFISFRPASWLASEPQRGRLAAFDRQLSPLLAYVAAQAGQPLENLEQVTAAFYAPMVPGEMPRIGLRFALLNPASLSTLKVAWQDPIAEKFGDRELLTTPDDRAYYVPQQPLENAQSIAEFSIGPNDIMRDVAQLQGAQGPLVLRMERLWKASDRWSDVSLVAAPAFLFTEGRELLARGPTRLSDYLKQILGNDLRALLVQTRFEPAWYLEVQLIGSSDHEAGKIAAMLQSELHELPNAIEAWLGDRSPHPHWLPLAYRFPQMLRTLDEFTRFGVEDGIAIANAHLPGDASVNILLASWIALQDEATLDADVALSSERVASAGRLIIEDYLARLIDVRFDQEPIEVAMQLIGNEANSRLPAGTPSMRFVLDGNAFEQAGITRNQQLRDFQLENQPVRRVLTEIAKRGNPDTSVSDTRQVGQKLIWVVTDDPESPGSQLISLTTRSAATAARIPLPTEFAP